MRKMRIRELQDWPPGPGGPHRHYKEPTSEQARLTRVDPKRRDAQVGFVCEFEGHEHRYGIKVRSETIAERIREVMRQNIGSTLYSLGDLQFECEASNEPAA